MQVAKFLKWASSSLIGHMVLFGVLCLGPGYLAFLVLIYSEGTLTVTWALYLALICGLMGVVGAIPVWYTITLPLIKQRKGGF